MATIDFTRDQTDAARALGRSVIVSAAAGSGKTAVLAERCAYVVCDAPPDQRCDVDQLLVLTFTDAAAEQMRSRIVETLRERARQRPNDDRLREQVALAPTAQISTIHAFCLWLVRRWFSELGIDPAAEMLDADEAVLLQRDVRDELFADLYARAACDDAPSLGVVLPPEDSTSPAERGLSDGEAGEQARVQNGGSAAPEDELARAFVDLVDRYGLGEDRDLGETVLRLAAFVTSLPDPDAWLKEARELPDQHPRRIVATSLMDCARELRLQIEHCDGLVAALRAGDSVAHPYAERIEDYITLLREWSAILGGDAPHAAGDAEEDWLTRGDQLFEQLSAHRLPRAPSVRLAKDADPLLRAACDLGKSLLKEVKERLWEKRLHARYGLFTVAERMDGLKATAPYVAAIVRLVSAFREEYARRKTRMNVLDFSDQLRLAHELLQLDGHGGEDSPRRSLHRRFAYVLVDEFQDINPIQEAIIQRISHESDTDRPGNLFVVGDVKQSVYRFRLADPSIFVRRVDSSRSRDAAGAAFFLRENFRSRPAILEAVNLLFSRLMRPGAGDVVYDEEAELRPGKPIDPNAPHQPVELHLLEKKIPADPLEQAPAGGGRASLSELGRLSAVEREAYWIGNRIKAWIADGDRDIVGRPLRYRDVVVLLRATKINAERVVAVLSSIGVPAYADAGGSMLGAREVRAVLAALRVLDNPLQDIPLASVLRSGILGEPLTEDELVEIRCLDRDTHFHEVVHRYAREGVDEKLRRHLAHVLDRIERLRHEVRQKPLCDVLWLLYERHGYLAYAGGLPHGFQRRANLFKLHELARKFGTFRRQGLRRFLRFIESFEEGNRDIGAAPTLGEAEDVVRVMSIHQSKGLEFPVVFVAGLGTKFNLGDRAGGTLFERDAGIGLRVVDAERMIEYPTVSHQRVADQIERFAREEELRILYVAMTRAESKLILVGSRDEARRFTESLQARRAGVDGSDGADRGDARPLSTLSITTATTPLDWLVPSLVSAPVGTVDGLGEDAADRPLYRVALHEPAEMATWSVVGERGETTDGTLRAAALGNAMPPEEPTAHGDPQVEAAIARADYTYASLGVTSIRAAIGASETKVFFDTAVDPEQRDDADSPLTPREPVRGTTTRREIDAVQRGLLTHRFLQHMDFAVAVDGDGVACELQRIESEGVLATEDRDLLDLGSIAWFVGTPLADEIRTAGSAYRREFRFIAAEPPSHFDPTLGETPDDHVLVRGIVDGILPAKDGIVLVDFKTDAVRAKDVESRAETYRPQMTAYARATARIWRRPVRGCVLVFLSAKRVYDLPDSTHKSDM